MKPPTLELRLLGSPVLRLDGVGVSMPTRKSLALVAYLTLEGPQTRAHLSDVLWGELDDAGARKNLRKELFRLRDTPLRAHLETDDDRVGLTAFSCDVSRFVALTETDAGAALEVYGGPLLMDLEVSGAERFQDWLDAARERLGNLYRRTLEAQARTLEDRGDLRAALDAFERLVGLDELQEVHHREVMRLRWRLGDRRGALAQFERLTQVLEHELGLEPLAETMALARRIEAADASDEPDNPQSNPDRTTIPNLERPPLVGREHAWAWLEAHMHGLALLVSDAGMGKTRLVGDYARSRGAHLVLRGFESASGTPFYPVAAGLRTALEAGQLEPDALEPVWRLEASRLVPELAGTERPTDGMPRPEGRARFLEGLSRAILCTVTNNGVLVLDDLHWFDASSLELISHLVRQMRANQASVQVIGTARALELYEHQSAQHALSALEREGLLVRHDLEPLSRAQVLSLVQSLSGDRAALFSSRLFEATGGNPLFLLETLRNLFQNALLRLEDGHWVTPFDEATEDYTELPIPPSVREIVLGRLDRLGGITRRWLEAASLAAEPFSADVLDGATALSDWERLDALERALEAQVLQPSEAPKGSTYRFGHDLIRRSLSGGLSLERRRLIHRRLASNLMDARGAPAVIADHLEHAERFADAIPWRIRAAEAAQAIYAHAEARASYQRALELGPDTRTAYAIHRAAANLAVSVLDLDGLLVHAQAMLELAQQANDAELEAQARLTIARHSIYRGQFALALKQAEHTLAGARSGVLMAETCLVAGTALVALGRLGEAEKRLLDGLRSTIPDAHELIAQLHEMLKVIHQQRGEYPQALEHARVATNAYRDARNRESELNMLAQTGQLHGALGQGDVALELISSVVRDAREHGLEKVLTFALVLEADECLRAREFETARNSIEEGLRLTIGKYPAREAQLSSLLGRLYHRLGQLSEAMRVSAEAFTLTERLGLAGQRALQHLVSADLELDLALLDPDRLSAAQRLLEQAVRLIEQTSQASLQLPLGTLQARLALASGQAQEAFTILQRSAALVEYATFEHCATHALTLAQTHLRLGQAKQALGVLESLRVPSWLEPRLLTVRLEIHAHLEPQSPEADTDLDMARRWTERPNVSGVDLIGLHQALALVFTTKKQPARARHHRAEAERLHQELHPPESGTLRERFGNAHASNVHARRNRP